MVGLRVNIVGEQQFYRRIAKLSDPSVRRRINERIGQECAALTADHFEDMGAEPEHHKTALKLGAQITGFWERAAGRTKYEVGDGGATVVVENQPGLTRAFHDLDIKAKKAKWLTIPTDKVSYARKVAELKKEGWYIFRPKKKGSKEAMEILLGSKKLPVEKKGKKKKKGHGGTQQEKWQTRLLYVLKKQVHIPKDPTLLPSKDEYVERAKIAIEMQMDDEGI